jgi:hypothetical protein
MIDPYPVGDDRRMYFDYFNRLYRRVKVVPLKAKQCNCLLYFVKHPESSAYDIMPSVKTSETSYRRAKLTVKRLKELGLIKLAGRGKHSSKKYSLTDEGIYYLIKNTRLPYTMLLQELIKNYNKSNIFQLLVYPCINLDTLCSPKMDPNIITGLGNYLVATFHKIDDTLLLLNKQVRSKVENYFWNYDKLEDFLRSKYHYNFINIVDRQEQSDEDYMEIRYFDIEKKDKYVKVIFNKNDKKGYIYTANKKVKKHIIPLVTDYLDKKTITQYDHMIGYFDAFCSIRAEEFILAISFIDVYNDDIREILSNDKSFMRSLKKTRDHFVWLYGYIKSDQLISYPDFMI